jgi:hypothetical protein
MAIGAEKSAETASAVTAPAPAHTVQGTKEERMKDNRLLGGGVAAALALVLMAGLVVAQTPAGSSLGTAFTYQGQLRSNGVPYTGTCDLRFELYDDADGGSQIGPTQTTTGVSVTDGYLTVELDFGSGAFSGDARWLNIEVCCPAGGCTYVPLTPRQALTPAPYALALPGLWTQQNDTSPNLIGGYGGNTVGDGIVGATIGGGGQSGYPNQVNADFATVGGGEGNTANGHSATVGGGTMNHADALTTTICGGTLNTAYANLATIAGGYGNAVSGQYGAIGGGQANSIALFEYSAIGGGMSNTVTGAHSVIGGGQSNTISSDHATVGGGQDNSAGAGYATVGGGHANSASSLDSTIGGGAFNSASGGGGAIGGGWDNVAGGAFSVVGGGRGNSASADFATIGGGGRWNSNLPESANRVTDNYGTVGGGTWNRAGDDDDNPANALYATVGGGWHNFASGIDATVGGGVYNSASADDAAIGGGSENVASGPAATIGGGSSNLASGFEATVGGGATNVAGSYSATVGGGTSNVANGSYATIGGGYNNVASGTYATVSGGMDNTASGFAATVPGGGNNLAQGEFSFAAGQRAKANQNGCFVWGDHSDLDITCDIADRWVARASGGVYFYTWPNLNDGVYVSAGGNSWNGISDRATKENLFPADGQAILEKLASLPVQEYNLKSQDPSIRHVGLMAQDFATFGYGESDKAINMQDADGVAMAAIQALYAQNQALAAQNAGQQQQIDALKADNADLNARLTALEQVVRGGKPAQTDSRLPVPWLLAGGLVVAGGAIASCNRLAAQQRRPGGGTR